VVRVGWEPGGREVSPYEVDLRSLGDVSLTCVAGPDVPARDVEPPLPSRPEPSPEVLAAAQAARAAGSRARARAWR
jgi:hypothetical protein